MSKNITSPDTTIGHYRIVSKLGAGAMGEVYLANDTRLDRKVALKILPQAFAEDDDRMSRFVREAKSASALNHPNIITIYEIGESEGTHFIATEFIDGKTLGDYAKASRLDYKAILEIAIQVASALQIAHAANIIHRDIKPDNVMIRADGLAKILDFGIAKLSAPTESGEEAATAIQSATTPGMIIGTPNYMSPEQARGRGVNHQTDIFSFGVVFYEMLSGNSPFEGETVSDVIASVLTKEPQPLANVPTELAAIVQKSLEKDKHKRYQTAKDLLDDLKQVKHGFESQSRLDINTAPSKDESKTQILQATTTATQSTGSTKIDESTINPQSATQNHKSKWWLLGLLSLLVIVVGFFGYKYLTSNNQIESIAVLPFQNKSSDADTEYLSDGLAESLIHRLSQLPNLKVSPTSSVMRYKGKGTDAITIGNELGVQAVMSGRIVQRGEGLTISIELVDVRNNKLLWGEQYNRKMSDLLATQREIAAEIANKLQLKLSGESEKTLTKRYTENNDAYQLYLKGRFHFAKRNKSDVERSVEYFKQAIALDPNFALAYSALADSYNGMTAYPYMAPKQAVPLAKAAATRAIQIDSTLAGPHAALANSLACFDWNWKEAEREFGRALEINPNDAGTHWRYGMFYLMPIGRHEEAIAEGKRSLELEPLDLNHGANLSGLYFYAGRYDEALEHARQVHGLDADFIVGRWALSQVYIQKGMYAEAIELNEEWLQTHPTNPVFLRFAGIAYAKAGRRQDAEKIIERFREIGKTQYVMSYHLALIYSALGDKDKAIAELETAFIEHDYLLPRIKVEPFLDPLRNEPRFVDIVRRLNFPE